MDLNRPKTNLLPHSCLLPLWNFALEYIVTLIFPVLVLGDWTVRSAASPARLVVQLILMHFMLFIHVM